MAAINSRGQIEQIVKAYVSLLQHEINVKNIYLYGSRINGSFTEDSDIDLAVIAEDFTGDVIEDRFKLMKLRRNIDYRIEPHPFLTNDFNESNPLAKEIMDTGVKII